MTAGERITKAIGIYSMFLGAAVILMWIMILSGETIGEGNTEMAFHLVSEFVMAGICLGSGACMARRTRKNRGAKPSRGFRRAVLGNLAGHAMVIYSVINAAGYYAERSESTMVVVFLVLLVLSACIMAIHFSKSLPGIPTFTPD